MRHESVPGRLVLQLDPQTRRALRLAHDLELSLSGVALVLDLLAEIERLQSALRRQ